MDIERAWVWLIRRRGTGAAVPRLFRARGFDFGGWPRPKGRAVEWDEIALPSKPLPASPFSCRAIRTSVLAHVQGRRGNSLRKL